MACRNGELREDVRNRNVAAVPSFAVGDALLFATMCIIGMPVDVYAKDGSVYSGIFHTASFDKNYAIVLKKARMIEKGNTDVNVVNETLIETLIVKSEDLVQVVAKGVLLPSNGIAGCAGNGSIEAAVGCNTYPDKDLEVTNLNESKGNKKHMSHRSSTAKAANHLGSSSEDHIERLDTMKLLKIEEARDVSVDRGNVDDGSSLEKQSEIHKNLESQNRRITSEVQGTSLSINSGDDPSITDCEGTRQQEPKAVSSVFSDTVQDQGQRWPPLDETACPVAPQPNISVASTPRIDANAGSCLRTSSNPLLFVPSKSSSLNRTIKDSKLNPGAKIFSPSMLHHRTGSPALPNGASVPYMGGTYTMAAPPEAEVNSFTHSSLPVKFVPYSNVAVGHGGHDAAYVQPILGQVVNRMQPARFTGQYQNCQMGPTYVHHPNPQNVMLGRMGPLVCMHPTASDVLQTAAGCSPAATRPLFPKHQGNASAQALQLCMNPPMMANGHQQFVMPTAVPMSQPIFTVLQPIAVPGTNGFLGTKHA